MTEYKRKQNKTKCKKREQTILTYQIILVISVIILFLFLLYQIFSLFSFTRKDHTENLKSSYIDNTLYTEDISISVDDTEETNELSLDEYPPEIIKMLQKNPETEEFVINYPSLKGSYSTESLTEALNQESVPLLMQWDSRWGYYEYSGSVMGVMGCGPVCLSMVGIHLLQNPDLTPIYIADYAVDNGYCVPGSGTSWELMSSGAAALGLHAEEVPLDENIVKDYLANGDPIICIMGKGIFTEDGHFIVMKGLEDDKIVINDPNSKARSEQLWKFADIQNQIRNMWVYKPA